jgi:hypothetical protein
MGIRFRLDAPVLERMAQVANTGGEPIFREAIRVLDKPGLVL